jgi:hypothetical protein
MGGGVAPWEYLVPPLAIAHTAYNRTANTFDFRKVNAQGSKNEKKDAAFRHNQEVLGEQQAQAATRAEELRYNTTPQSAAEQLQSRQRAKLARASLGGSASQQLTSATLG